MAMSTQKKSASKPTAKKVSKKASNVVSRKVSAKTSSKPLKKAAKKPSPPGDISHLTQDIVDTIGAGIYLVQKGKFVSASPLYEKLTGYPAKDLTGKNLLDYIHPDDRPMIEKRQKKQNQDPYEYRFIRRDGETIWFLETSGFVVYQGSKALQASVMDISRYKQTEESIRIKEERYSTVLQDIADNYYEIDLKGNFTFVNDALVRHIGYSKEELIGMNYRRYCDAPTAEKLKELFYRVYKTGKPFSRFEAHFIIKDGSIRVAEVSGALIRNKQGKAVGFRGVSRDITEHKQAQIALRRSEERYRTILEDIDQCYFEIDLKGRFTFVNDTQCRDLGYTREELIGMDYRKYTEEATLQKTRGIFADIYKTGKPAEYEGVYIHKNGTIYCSEVFVSVMRDPKGKPIGFRGLSRNISDRKKMEEALRASEERYRTTLDEMDEGYGELDLKGTWTFVNNAGARNIGYEPEELIGTNYRQVTDDDSAKKMFELFNEVYKTGQPFKSQEVQFITKQGNRRIIEISGALRRDEKGKPVGFRGLSRDITERKWAEEALLQSEAKYVSIVEGIDEAFFETDLTGIMTFANDKTCRDLGYTREELLRMSNRQLQDDENARKTYEVFNKVYKTGYPVKNYHYQAIRKNGTKADFEISISLIRDARGKPIGFRGLSRDITERQKIEDALRASEEKYRTIIETIQDGYLEIDLTNHYTFVNDVVSEHLGYSRKELVGMDGRQVQDEEGFKKTRKVFMDVLKTGKPVKAMELAIIRKNGTKGTYELSISLIRNANGQPTGFRCVSRDISERKKMEDALRASEERHRSILENMQEAYFENDLSGHILSVNGAASRHLGYSKEELIGMKSSELQDEAGRKKTYQAYNRLFQTGTPIKALESEFIRKGGSRGIYELSVDVIRDARGTPVGFRGVSRDVTERKKMEDALRASEERARNLIATIPDPYVERDLQGKAVYVNDAYIALTGYSAPELQNSGFSYRQYTDTRNAAIISDTYDTVIKTGLTMKNVELEIITKSGEKRQVNLSATLVRDNQGNPTGVQSIVRDITEKKKAEEMIRQSEKSLREYSETLELRVRERTAELEKAKFAAEAASRTKSDFMANISHEFQTPLNAVIGFTKVLQDRMFGELNEKQDEFLRYIAEAGTSLSKIITEILDATHASSKSVKLNITSVSIADMLSKATKLLAPQIEEKHQVLTVDVALEADVSIEADEQKLQQVLFHVLNNAVKYNIDGGSVHIRAFKTTHEISGREGISIAVTDTGKGIKKEDLPKLFQTFSTLESPYTRTGKGIGMGLSLAKQLLELHGGGISVESEYGSGSCFTIFLPLEQKKTGSME